MPQIFTVAGTRVIYDTIDTPTETLGPPTLSTKTTTLDLGFQPKMVILWTTMDNVDNDGINANARFGIGAFSRDTGFDSFSKWTVGSNRINAVSPSQVNGRSGNGFCLLVPSVGALGFDFLSAYVDFTSIIANGVIIRWSRLQTTPVKVHYLAFDAPPEGVDFKCGTFNNSTSVGNQAITGVGFQPDGVLFLTNFANFPQGTDHDDIGLSCTGSNPWAFSTVCTNGANPTVAKSIYDDSRRCILRWGNGATQYEAEMISYDSNGFTINSITNDGIARPYSYIAFKGLQAKASSFNTPSGATSSVSVPVGFKPEVLLLLGTGAFAAQASMSQFNNIQKSFALALSTSEQAGLGVASTTGVATSEEWRSISTQYALQILQNTSSRGYLQRGALANISNAGFDVNLNVTDGLSRKCFYLALKGFTSSTGSGTNKFTKKQTMEISPNTIAYMTIPHTTAGLLYADWTVYLYKNGQQVLDVPYDIRETPSGVYTFSFKVDSEDESQWSLLAYETADTTQKYLEQWRVRRKVAEQNIKQVRSRMDSDGGFFNSSK